MQWPLTSSVCDVLQMLLNGLLTSALYALRCAVPITSFRFHLILHWVHRWQPRTHFPWTHMCHVNKVCGFSDHGAIYSPPPLRLRLLGDAAAETHPELGHVPAALTSFSDFLFSLPVCLTLVSSSCSPAAGVCRKSISATDSTQWCVRCCCWWTTLMIPLNDRHTVTQ